MNDSGVLRLLGSNLGPLDSYSVTVSCYRVLLRIVVSHRINTYHFSFCRRSRRVVSRRPRGSVDSDSGHYPNGASVFDDKASVTSIMWLPCLEGFGLPLGHRRNEVESHWMPHRNIKLKGSL